VHAVTFVYIVHGIQSIMMKETVVQHVTHCKPLTSAQLAVPCSTSTMNSSLLLVKRYFIYI